MKIITVTMNPAVDKTVQIKRLRKGGLNRAGQVRYDAGGKGINVSKTVSALGGHSLATGLLGVRGSGPILACLDEEKINHDFIIVDAETRTNLKLTEEDGCVTEVNEAGPLIQAGQLEALQEKLVRLAGPEVLFVFAGSVPPNVPEYIYQRLINAVHQKGAKALLDADGPLFARGMEAKPEYVKPNLEEAAAYTRQLIAGNELDAAGWDILKQPVSFTRELAERLGKTLLERGARTVLLSCGADGALFLQQPDREGEPALLYFPACRVEARSTVGAGDAMTGALCRALAEGLDFEDTAILCMAAAAGAVMTEGTKTPPRSRVERLMQRIRNGEY